VGWILRNGSGSQDEGPRKQTQGIPSSTRNLYFANQYFHKQDVANTVRLYVPCGPHAQAECRREATQKMEARHQKTGTTHPPTRCAKRHQRTNQTPSSQQPSSPRGRDVPSTQKIPIQHTRHHFKAAGSLSTRVKPNRRSRPSPVVSAGGVQGGVHPSGNARTGQSSQLAWVGFGKFVHQPSPVGWLGGDPSSPRSEDH
jgi:hypothetical protein